MTIYFGIIKEGVSFSEVKKRLSDAGIAVLNHYPVLRIVRFKTDEKISNEGFDFFLSIEEEREDFSVQ